jgi:hypothetical protein
LNKKGSHFWLCKCDCGKEKPVNKYQLGKTSKQCAQCAQKGIDIRGQKFGRLTAIKYRPDKSSGYWECLCECGTTCFCQTSHLLNGTRTNCKYCTFEDLTGKRFGSQTVIKRDFASRKWLVLCDCGEEKLKKANLIKNTSSCGRCETKRFLNQRFGRLVVVEIVYHGYKPRLYAKCDCGNWWEGTPYHLSENSSCGCLRRDKNIEEAKKSIGQKSGDLLIKKVLGFVGGTERILYLCKCSCGKDKILPRTRMGELKSCGCKQLMNKNRGEDHPMANLTQSQADAIREFANANAGYSQKEIAAMFNVPTTTISRIVTNQTYKDS